MKIALCSDLHLEFGDIVLKNTENADVLILSGDILIAQDMHDNPEDKFTDLDLQLSVLMSRQLKVILFRDFLRRCSTEFENVVYVAGNHEFYHGKWPIGIKYLKEECHKFSNVHFLEMESVKIKDITFVGGTLWTDMNHNDPLTLHTVKGLMNDFRLVRNSDKNFRPLLPEDVMNRHRQTMKYIQKVVESNHDEKIVVVGHHAPSLQSIPYRYSHDKLMNGAYASNLDEFILNHPQIKLWTHGHTHTLFDYMIGDTRIVCNPRGYQGYEQISEDFTLKFLEI